MNAPADALLSGVVVSARASVVDLRFDDGLPPIYALPRAGDDQQVLIEVQSQLDMRSGGAVSRSRATRTSPAACR